MDRRWRRRLDGKLAERRAQQFLERAGLVVVARNYRTRWGELDLVMHEGDTVVFVEVRARAPNSVLSAAESVDWAKQHRLQTTAEHYLARYHGVDTPACRFDVIAMTGSPNRPHITWIRDAFDT
ncbi:MAG: YraN family protein [Pseudomonadota bacterium]